MKQMIVLAVLAGFTACGNPGIDNPETPDAPPNDPPADACVGAACGMVGTCPPGMVWIDPTTCIDAKEATVNDFLQFLDTLGSACTDPGPTCTACGGKRCFISNVDNPWHYDEGWYIDGQVGLSLEHPARYVTHAAAFSACARQGKRLCTPDAWQRACGGAASSKYPYGETFVAGKCNSASGITGRPWPVGDNPACANTTTPELVDMSGNVWEWTSECFSGDCELRGGSFFVDGSFFPNALSCEGTKGHDTSNETFGTEHDFGYRCCDSPL
jgi:formylglycine-generating enzyme required for sulfatase activity